MIRIRYKLMMAVMASIVLFSSSCKKTYLTLLPPTALPPEQALLTEADLQAALRGAYAGLKATDLFGRTVPLLGDLMADNAYVSLTNTGRYNSFNSYTWLANDGNVTGYWRGAYTAILRANNIINAAPTGTVNISQYKGEAYAIRALCYFYLVRNFAKPYTDDPNGLGVPIILTYDPAAKPVRSKISDVYALILADLTQAYNLMTLFTNSTQFSKYAARGLQAKVYLAMGDKSNAKTAALDVINNGGFTLVPAAGYVGYWSVLLPRTDKVETLFELSFDAVSSSGFDGLANIYNQLGYGDMLASSDFLPAVIFSAPPATPPGNINATGTVVLSGSNVASVTITNPGSGYTTAPIVTFSAPSPSGGVTAIGTAVLSGSSVASVTITNPGSSYSQLLSLADVRRGLYPTGAKGGQPAVFVNNKYPGTFGGDVSDTKILRLSEMYLIAAETSLPADETGAKTYVNTITAGRNATAIASTGATLLDDIITERRKELAFEGDRHFDMQRLKRDITRSVNYPASALSILYSNTRRILPIPQAELDANANIRSQQNPGY